MKRTTRILAAAASVGVLAIAAAPAASQAAPISPVCSALGLPDSTTPISLGALGAITITTCNDAVLGHDPCTVLTTIPVNVLLPGVVSLKGGICL